MDRKNKFVSAVPEGVDKDHVQETIVYIVEKPDCTIRVIETENESEDDLTDDEKENETSLEKLDLGKLKDKADKDAEDPDFAKDRAKKPKKGAADTDSDATEKENKRRKLENDKDDDANSSKKSEDKKMKVYVTDFRVNRAKVASASPFFKTMLTSKYFKDTGKDVVELDCTASVLNVILCAAQGIYTKLAADKPLVSAADLFEQCIANPHTATSILDSMRVPAHEMIAVMAKAKEYMLDSENLTPIGNWLRLWNAHTTDKTSFDVSMVAAAWHLHVPGKNDSEMANAFADWVADAIEQAQGPIRAIAPTGYEEFEIPGKLLVNMNAHRERFIMDIRLAINRIQSSEQIYDFWTSSITKVFNITSLTGELDIKSVSQILELASALKEKAPVDSSGNSRLHTWKPGFDLVKLIEEFQASRRCFCLLCIKRSLAEGYDRNSNLWRIDVNKQWENICPRGHGFAIWNKSFMGSTHDRDEFINACQGHLVYPPGSEWGPQATAGWGSNEYNYHTPTSFYNARTSRRRSGGRG